MTDTLTILRHQSNLLAKTWRADGTVTAYDQAKYFTLSSVPLAGIADLSTQLSKLEHDPHACVIRGVYRGDAHAVEAGLAPENGRVRRLLELFDDTPHHWVLVEIDSFEPLTADPVRDPVPAIDEYVATCLPDGFQGAAYHWQLSNSAGHATKGGILKAHVWFWLETPYTSAQLKAWAKVASIELDDSVLNPVQVHYTAAPVFDAGVVDPVPVRSGFVPGLLDDAVALTIDQAVLDQALALKPRQRGDLVETDDPVADLLYTQGRVLDEARDGGLIIACPWEDEHTNDTTGTDSTVWFPAGTNGYDRGHFKCLHTHCADRLDIEFFEAIGYQEDVLAGFDVIPPPAGGELPLPAFERVRSGKDEGKILATVENVALAVRRSDICSAFIGYDTFQGGMVIADQAGQWRAFEDTDYTQLRITLEHGPTGFKPISNLMMKDAAKLVAKENQFDSAQQWLNGLAHDGTPRVEGFMARYFGTEDTPYMRAVGLYLWTAMAGRIMEPGIKADMVPILVGPQGAGKSTGVAAMVPGGDLFAELNLADKDADQARLLRGKLLAEISELRGLRTRELEAIKAFITRTHEQWVPKFEEFATAYARRCVFIGTTNQDEFLADETGNRRWLPARVGVVDVQALQRDHDPASFPRTARRW
ncbi:virulence-associated E family protein [Paralcaligenes sp. KSB-10]|uniref:virulence-associated E family protein n=1 Tax=Paralcaligenes sp. KSB-10 TaxID=2901142 RepID=UPI001E32CBB0|nr:virulence-associated E family protein [Paralcaligenes sp. KSB-10]UHL65570.1 virulence-associated E family protein [Paralcaligenes sp. KSB-10]